MSIDSSDPDSNSSDTGKDKECLVDKKEQSSSIELKSLDGHAIGSPDADPYGSDNGNDKAVDIKEESSSTDGDGI